VIAFVVISYRPSAATLAPDVEMAAGGADGLN